MNYFSWNVLDGLLRGTLANAEAPRFVRSLLCWQVALASFYGLCLGLFALSARESPDARFMLAAGLKLPILILGSTAVTLPSLYVFLALFDVPLRFKQVLVGMLAANTIFATVIASMGPILAFFSLSSQSYPFILLLNVVICGFGGLLGMRMVIKTLNAASPPAVVEKQVEPSQDEMNEGTEGAKDGPSVPKPVSGWRGIIGVWMVLYVFVGTQLAWILRPFIGQPDSPFVWFRGKSGGFVDTVIRALGEYLGG
ncbi:MAG: hypothetical protein ACI957_000971 [Verrucomicrobiales bacterium]|jgi:hypothetical protein